MSKLKKEIVLVLVSGCLLLSLVFYMTYAWYTKIVSVGSPDFIVAEWDFSANHSTGDIGLNVLNYINVETDRVAPGTEGMIPVQLSAGAAQTDVVYAITIDKSAMHDKFKERLHFYYKTSDEGDKIEFSDTDYINGSLNVVSGNETEKIVYIYWRWFFDYEEYICYEYNLTEANFDALREATDATIGTVLEGIVLEDGQDAALQTIFLNYDQYEQEYDEFDTMAAKDKEQYATYMAAHINISGAEPVPQVQTE